MTNISRIPKKDVVKRLWENGGIKATEDKIVGVAEAAIDFMKAKKQMPACFLVANKEIKKDFKKAGIKIIEKGKADFVVLFVYGKINHKMLETAFRMVSNGAQIVANSDDRFFPGDDGLLTIGTGFFLKGLEYSTGKRGTIVGKPNKEFFRAALAKINAKPNETLMVGDSVFVDVAGAKNSGITAVLVKTGSFRQQDLEKSVIKPDAVIESIADLPRYLEEKK